MHRDGEVEGVRRSSYCTAPWRRVGRSGAGSYKIVERPRAWSGQLQSQFTYFPSFSLLVLLTSTTRSSPSTRSMATETPTPPLTTYSGSCSCGAFGYTVALPAITSVFECNCSICARRGFKWIFPGTNPFTVTKDDGTLTEYQFGAKNMTHKVCLPC